MAENEGIWFIKLTEFYKVAELAQIPEEGSKVIDFMRKEIALFRHAGKVYALDNLCPHRQAPLSTGEIADGAVLCPWHKARFDLATGKGLPGPHRADIGCYQVEIVNDDIMLKR